MKILLSKKILYMLAAVGLSFCFQPLGAQAFYDLQANQRVAFSNLKLTPAYVPQNKISIGVIHDLQANVTLPTSLNRIIEKNDAGEAFLNLNSLISEMRNLPATSTFNYDLLSVGIRNSSGYYSLQYGLGANAVVKFSEKLVELIEKGNSAGETVNAGGLSAGASAYSQLAIGYANDKLLDGRLTLGGRMLLRFGAANAQLQVEQLDVYTAPDGSSIDIDSKSRLAFSSPAFIQNVLTDTDGKFNDVEMRDSPVFGKLFSLKNTAVGFDLGASYRALDNLTIGASVLNIGLQKWKDEAYIFRQSGSINFKGENLNDEDGEAMIDSTLTHFYLDENSKEYSEAFNSTLRLFASYDILPSLNAYTSLLLRNYYGTAYPELNVVGTYSPARWFSVALGGRVSSGNFNLGASLVLGYSFQMFLAADNLLAVNYTNVEHAGIRMGAAFNF